MTRLPTQTAKYWVEDFKIEKSDIEYLNNVLLENETPLSSDEMAFVLIHQRMQNDVPVEDKTPSKGEVYDPALTYETGDMIMFPAPIGGGGKVISVRAGNNPDVTSFSVITVALSNGDIVEFASGLPLPHPLNTAPEVIVEDDSQPDRSAKELFVEFGGYVADAIDEAFEGQTDLVRLAKRWFPISLLVDMNVGHMNLAEAVLDMFGGGPLSTPEILEHMGMFDEVNSRLAEFSMNYHLNNDDRFDEVGMSGQVRWFLKRLEPTGVHVTPKWLEYTPIDYDPEGFPAELRELELEIGDEHTALPRQRESVPESVTVTLTYPHLRAGTIPLSRQLKRMFPTAYSSPRIYFTLVDSDSGEEIPAWVVRNEGYVYGLQNWFSKRDIPIGGYLTLARTDIPGKVEITYAQRRNPHVEWLRTVDVKDHKPIFAEMTHPVGCDYDDLLIIHVQEPEAVDELGSEYKKKGLALETLINQLSREIAALSPQKTIHGKTLYSAVNIFRRCPPGPIFDRLMGLSQLEFIGDGYWQVNDQESRDAQ